MLYSDQLPSNPFVDSSTYRRRRDDSTLMSRYRRARGRFHTRTGHCEAQLEGQRDEVDGNQNNWQGTTTDDSVEEGADLNFQLDWM